MGRGGSGGCDGAGTSLWTAHKARLSRWAGVGCFAAALQHSHPALPSSAGGFTPCTDVPPPVCPLVVQDMKVEAILRSGIRRFTDEVRGGLERGTWGQAGSRMRRHAGGLDPGGLPRRRRSQAAAVGEGAAGAAVGPGAGWARTCGPLSGAPLSLPLWHTKQNKPITVAPSERHYQTPTTPSPLPLPFPGGPAVDLPGRLLYPARHV